MCVSLARRVLALVFRCSLDHSVRFPPCSDFLVPSGLRFRQSQRLISHCTICKLVRWADLKHDGRIAYFAQLEWDKTQPVYTTFGLNKTPLTTMIIQVYSCSFTIQGIARKYKQVCWQPPALPPLSFLSFPPSFPEVSRNCQQETPNASIAADIQILTTDFFSSFSPQTYPPFWDLQGEPLQPTEVPDA